ncbi:FAD-linked oxidase C-terminal domain-containing protein [Marinobacter sp. M3C]|jgi:FAD/FMN-containing dehydrogenase|uniref:FAD-linked oxidase C-terminal domain-containing protein n=1 Tax=Marinobacter sp. M3C TaxID=2917715 RepID=UPI0024B3BE8F|nr:FAD-linked oxidase C-terminal domain-containing protein [Marinobacter sp. M3C]
MKLFAVLDSFDGSISTEHGIGRTKQATYMSRLSPMELEHARGIKTLFDPDGLMNAGRILPCR